MENDILFSFKLSFQVALIATTLVFFIGTFIAYFLSQKKFVGREIVNIIFTLPLVLPPTVTGYYLVVVLGRNGVVGQFFESAFGSSIMFTWYAAVFAAFVVSLPLMINTAKASISNVDPDLINASYTLGNGEWRTVRKVILPLSKKGLMAGAILTFARALGEFGATLMVAGNIPGKTNTIPLTIFNLVENGDWATANTIVLIYTLIAGALLYFSNYLGRRL